MKIPPTDVPEKRSVEPGAILRILAVTPVSGREELAHDFLLLSMKLAAINAVDLYRMERECLQNGKLCYRREKTKTGRRDKAYFEVGIMDDLYPLFEKYRGKNPQCIGNFIEGTGCRMRVISIDLGLN